MNGPGLVVPADGVLVGAALVAASTVGGLLLSRWSARRPVASSDPTARNYGASGSAFVASESRPKSAISSSGRGGTV